MILIIDNYDSFTYNLVNIVEQYEPTIVKYPDDPTIDDISHISGLIISPGPGHPLDNNYLTEIIEKFKHLPILGICLGAQALTCFYGGKVIQGEFIKHGKVDTVALSQKSLLYQNIPKTFKIMRYHSLISDKTTFPKSLIVTGNTEDCIQSFEHQDKLHFGIQYHPESFATEFGEQMIINFLNLTKKGH